VGNGFGGDDEVDVFIASRSETLTLVKVSITSRENCRTVFFFVFDADLDIHHWKDHIYQNQKGTKK